MDAAYQVYYLMSRGVLYSRTAYRAGSLTILLLASIAIVHAGIMEYFPAFNNKRH